MRTMAVYVALLRGINVGGKNIIRMADLRACLLDYGLAEVRTYIQSGNVVFSSSAPKSSLEAGIRRALSKRFAYDAELVLRTLSQMKTVVEEAPQGFGSEPKTYRYDVMFLLDSLSPKRALRELPTNEGVDTIHAGRTVVYFRRLIAKATQSRLTRIVGTPIYQEMTIRNWNTTTKLLELMAPV